MAIIQADAAYGGWKVMPAESREGETEAKRLRKSWQMRNRKDCLTDSLSVYLCV